MNYHHHHATSTITLHHRIFHQDQEQTWAQDVSCLEPVVVSFFSYISTSTPLIMFTDRLHLRMMNNAVTNTDMIEEQRTGTRERKLQGSREQVLETCCNASRASGMFFIFKTITSTHTTTTIGLHNVLK